MIRPVRILGVLLVAAVLSAGTAAGEERRTTGADVPKLRMDELEVRGKPEKTPVLYLPVPEGRYLLSPPRLDLIREELIRPVFPPEVAAEFHPQRGHSREGEQP